MILCDVKGCNKMAAFSGGGQYCPDHWKMAKLPGSIGGFMGNFIKVTNTQGNTYVINKDQISVVEYYKDYCVINMVNGQVLNSVEIFNLGPDDREATLTGSKYFVDNTDEKIPDIVRKLDNER